MFCTLSRLRTPPLDLGSGVGRIGTGCAGRGVAGTGVEVADGAGVGELVGVEVGGGGGVCKSPPARGVGVDTAAALGIVVGGIWVAAAAAVGSEGTGESPQAADSNMTNPSAAFMNEMEMSLNVMPCP